MYCGETRVGSIDGVFAEGTAAMAEYIVVRWDSRQGMPVLVATKDVQMLDERGVTLIGDEPGQYITAPRYEEKSYPSLRRIH